MLGEKLRRHEVKVWMINTGLTGGAYGTGNRMKLSYTRAMITAALEGKLDQVEFNNHPVFGMAVPQSCPNVPAELLNPRNTWADKEAYDAAACNLAQQFIRNFETIRSRRTRRNSGSSTSHLNSVLECLSAGESQKRTISDWILALPPTISATRTLSLSATG